MILNKVYSKIYVQKNLDVKDKGKKYSSLQPASLLREQGSYRPWKVLELKC